MEPTGPNYDERATKAPTLTLKPRRHKRGTRESGAPAQRQRLGLRGTRLTVARRLQGLTKAELARSLQVTPTAIAQYEKGSRPTQATLAQICLTLGMPRDFFGAGATPELLPASSAHFRSLRSTTSKAREQVLAYGELSLQLVDLIADYIDFPPVDYPISTCLRS